MTSKEILENYIEFYEKRGHKIVPNVSLVPENDPTLLFVNSGMFPLVPYLSGQPHPEGKRIVNFQRCVRFDDLEEVGDYNHTVAFHMMGNWSLGDYFKKDQLPWAYEFLVEVLGLDINRMYATVFEGDDDAPKDTESIEILVGIFKKYGVDATEGTRIFPRGKKDNWWKRGDAIGELGGPDSEIFYYVGDGEGGDKNPAEHDQEFLEIGNSVFMQYKKTETGWEELPQKNVDFGGGLERIALAVQNKRDIFETDNFWPIVQAIEKITNKNYGSDEITTRAMRILADHIRTAVFLAMDGVAPSNKDQGYILRRVLRRMVRAGRTLGIEQDISTRLVEPVVQNFSWIYPQLVTKQKEIEVMFSEEEAKFRKVLVNGAKEAQKLITHSGVDGEKLASGGFELYQSLGYPAEMFIEDIKEAKLSNIDITKLTNDVNAKIKAHKEKSRQGAQQKFSGGLADQEEQTVRYHTATHLLHWALREVLGEHVTQQGSNITGERLRFDISHEKKLTPEQVVEVETLVNDKIAQAIPVAFVILPKVEAEKTGATHFFGDKYGDSVKIYYIGTSLEDAFSREFCGGPHVTNTAELEPIRIYKQEKIGKGTLRLYVNKR